MLHIDSSMNHDCIGSLGSIPNEPKSVTVMQPLYVILGSLAMTFKKCINYNY